MSLGKQRDAAGFDVNAGERVLRLGSITVNFGNGDQAMIGGIHAHVSVAHRGIAVGDLSNGAIGRNFVQVLVSGIDEKRAAFTDEIGSTSVLVNTASNVERCRGEFPRLLVYLLEQGNPSAFRRAALEPIQLAGNHVRFGDTRNSLDNRFGGNRRRPASVTVHKVGFNEGRLSI